MSDELDMQPWPDWEFIKIVIQMIFVGLIILPFFWIWFWRWTYPDAINAGLKIIRGGYPDNSHLDQKD